MDTSPRASFTQVQPILGTRDIESAIAFYTQRLGFTLAFRDGSTPTNYVGFRRDQVELHMQFQYEHEMQGTRLRLVVNDPDALFAEYLEKQAADPAKPPKDTPWGTREFALYDSDGNALTFYRDLKR